MNLELLKLYMNIKYRLKISFVKGDLFCGFNIIYIF